MSNSTTNTALASQIRTALLETHHLPPPSQPWLQTLLSSRTPPPPLPSLVMTAKTRLLASDLTTPGLLDPARLSAISFPPHLADPTVKEVELRADVYAQVLDIEDLSRSRWDQVEALEAVERGECTRGREVIRLAAGAGDQEGRENQQQTQASTTTTTTAANTTTTTTQPTRGGQQNSVGSGKNATHRLILQDCKGNKIYALEMIRLPKIGIGSTNIGEKILLKQGSVVARGVVMLDPGKCEILGGKVEAWQRAWTEGRLTRLKGAAVVEGEG